LIDYSGWLFQPMREEDRGASSRIVMPLHGFLERAGLDEGPFEARAGGVRDKRLG
jgi:hypothetical protein